MDFRKYKLQSHNGLNQSETNRKLVLEKTIAQMRNEKHPDVTWEYHGRQMDLKEQEITELKELAETRRHGYNQEIVEKLNLFKRDAFIELEIEDSPTFAEKLFHIAQNNSNANYQSIFSMMVKLKNQFSELLSAYNHDEPKDKPNKQYPLEMDFVINYVPKKDNARYYPDLKCIKEITHGWSSLNAIKTWVHELYDNGLIEWASGNYIKLKGRKPFYIEVNENLDAPKLMKYQDALNNLDIDLGANNVS